MFKILNSSSKDPLIAEDVEVLQDSPYGRVRTEFRFTYKVIGRTKGKRLCKLLDKRYVASYYLDIK